LALHSPAANGRTGAGYGGFFWRAPAIAGAARILSPVGNDVPAVHGATAPWLAITADAGDGPWTMLFLPGDEITERDPWFVRARDYLGVGSSMAWNRPLMLEPAETATRTIVTVVIDGAESAAKLEELADGARSIA
jgi:hypothetical protein